MTVCASTTLTAGASRAQSTAEIDLPAPDSAPSKIGRLPPRKLLAPPQEGAAHPLLQRTVQSNRNSGASHRKLLPNHGSEITPGGPSERDSNQRSTLSIDGQPGSVPPPTSDTMAQPAIIDGNDDSQLVSGGAGLQSQGSVPPPTGTSDIVAQPAVSEGSADSQLVISGGIGLQLSGSVPPPTGPSDTVAQPATRDGNINSQLVTSGGTERAVVIGNCVLFMRMIQI
ncbi:hypothetical protein WJX75_002718 [Coccomyxa subellipsoidea]|uniref:Uncharacterized protein n=1 Tax=Coccomyxa subellipsoidea TaxID=248742 RepID=A0ABR2YGJ0_9CHLO